MYNITDDNKIDIILMLNPCDIYSLVEANDWNYLLTSAVLEQIANINILPFNDTIKIDKLCSMYTESRIYDVVDYDVLTVEAVRLRDFNYNESL